MQIEVQAWPINAHDPKGLRAAAAAHLISACGKHELSSITKTQVFGLHAKSEFVIGGKMVTYNEVIIDTGAYFRGLPHSILAFLCTASASDEQRKAARKAHSSFLSKYSAAKGSTPLLVYDPSKSSQPFSLSE